MKLHANLNPSSVRGNCGGDLRLFFTNLSPHDWHVPPAVPAPGMWQGGGNGAFNSFTLTTHDKVELNLNLVGDQPGLLFVFGNITVTPAGGNPIGPLLDGLQAPPPFDPDHAHHELLKGRKQISVSGVQYDMGFVLNVPWDGSVAECAGTWWAMWSPVAPSGLHV
jgi:hypothetical protein